MIHMRRRESSHFVENIALNNGNSLAGRLEHEMFPFEVDSALVNIQSKSHAP
jgi:hypothetical protein